MVTTGLHVRYRQNGIRFWDIYINSDFIERCLTKAESEYKLSQYKKYDIKK